jgi:hypothetical protein
MPKNDAKKSVEVGSIMAMRSPGTMSRAISPCATACAAACRSRYVMVPSATFSSCSTVT